MKVWYGKWKFSGQRTENTQLTCDQQIHIYQKQKQMWCYQVFLKNKQNIENICILSDWSNHIHECWGTAADIYYKTRKLYCQPMYVTGLKLFTGLL